VLTGKVCESTVPPAAIGQAVAKRFASEGAVVVGVDKVEHSVGGQAMWPISPMSPRSRHV